MENKNITPLTKVQIKIANDYEDLATEIFEKLEKLEKLMNSEDFKELREVDIEELPSNQEHMYDQLSLQYGCYEAFIEGLNP